MTDFFPFLIALLILVLTFVSAMYSGVVKLIASGSAALVLTVVLITGIHLLPVLADSLLDVELTWKMTFGLTSVFAVLAYTISRFVFGWFFKKLLGPDSWFHWMADGIPGGVLSIFPACVIIFFLFNCFRIGGTVLELNYIATLSQEGILTTSRKIPGYPMAARWRNGIEAVPGIPEALDLIDPFSHRGNRNAVALFMVSQTTPLQNYLASQPETSAFVEDPSFAALAGEPELDKFLQSHQRVPLVTHPKVRALVADYKAVKELKRLKFQPLLDGFVSTIEPPPAAVVELPSAN